MFYECESLNSLPDISKWNTSNVNNMNWMFSGCESLYLFFDISKWNINTITNKYIINMSKINITINVDKNDVNKKIYFLDNYYYNDEGDEKYTHEHLKELNEYNTELYINNKIEKYGNFFILKKRR